MDGLELRPPESSHLTHGKVPISAVMFPNLHRMSRLSPQKPASGSSFSLHRHRHPDLNKDTTNTISSPQLYTLLRNNATGPKRKAPCHRQTTATS